ncbi:thrombospondin type-1 domain-containing protein 7B-like [Engraulis encrasicolus]|uniref:thrombospondin type-1 domain-containing protein 7B-like n=1 Tax=Engraulis encrasicolus TaxID=184585 RepID=UPI002FD230D7
MWGVCVAETCGSAGVQSRAVWCVHSDGWTAHPSNCGPSDRPSPRRPCVRVCEWHRTLFEWQLSAWGPCSPLSTSTSTSSSSSSSSSSSVVSSGECVTAQRGVQRRRVTCSRRTDGEVASDDRVCEAFSPRPSDEQACLLPCPINCVLSAFSHWSPCLSQSCGSSALQHRTRQVLAAPLYGGAECPSLTETRRCHRQQADKDNPPPPCPASQPEHSYSLWAGPWSECRVRVAGSTNGRTRVDFSMDPVVKSEVKGSEEVVVVKRHKESIFRMHDHSHQHHSQQHQHHNHHHAHHHLYAAGGYDSHIGYQTRQVRCIRSDGKNVMLSLCDHDNAPVNFRTCVMPRDCNVSDWSEWSPCSKTCRTVDQSPGFRTRKRHVIGLQTGEGKECPALEEKEACNLIADLLPLCPSYEWQVTGWGRCQSLPLLSQQDHRHGNAHFLCGGGIQTREVYCARMDHSTSPSYKLRPVRRDLCSGPFPPLVQNCSTSCPEPCLLSHWSEWGPCVHDDCSEVPGKRGFHVRKRSVLGGTTDITENCPHLTEAMPCDEPISCFSWRVTSQGPCTPLDGLCSNGTQQQTVECMTASGETVPEDRCPGDQPPTDSPCELACASDCVLSDWSAWSQCSLSCSGKHSEGKQHRTRSVLALPGEGGAACPNASSLQQWRPCGSGPCVQLHWAAGPWGPCTPGSLGGWPFVNASEPELEPELEAELHQHNTTCGLGSQAREVSCVRANNGVVTAKRCPLSSRPLSERVCELPCPVDCVVTPFSEWSSCPDTCTSENATAVTQSRHRIVVQRPTNGGQDCPDTLYEERECEPPPACPIYSWQTHRWQKCILVPDSVRQAVGASTESCGQGLETRVVRCVGADDMPAELWLCVRWAGPVPARVRGCRVACRDDCTVSSWSGFTPCQGCGGWRTRTRALTGRSKKRVRCQQQPSLYPLLEREPCPCSEFQARTQGSWSVCLLPDASDLAATTTTTSSSWHLARPGGLQGLDGVLRWRPPPQGEVKECGQGRRYRALACVDHRGHLLEPTLCASSGLEEEVCHVACPLDCRLSEWSAWSPCNASCGWGVKVRAQWLKEKAFNGGRPCPKLDVRNQAQVSEVQPCYSECNQYSWEVEPWADCHAHLPESDSTSLDSRDSQANSPRGGAADSNGTTDTASTAGTPTGTLSSAWAPTETPSSADVAPTTTSFGFGSDVAVVNTSWLPEGVLSCGNGAQTRKARCVRRGSHGRGQHVHESLCGQLELPITSRTCQLPCPSHCVTSQWSQWSTCPMPCQLGVHRRRDRQVLRYPQAAGHACPELNQTDVCLLNSTCFNYSYSYSGWSSCQLNEKAVCGRGIKTRLHRCLRSDGRQVEISMCAEEGPSEELAMPCEVSCPVNCLLSAWSLWSECSHTCGNQSQMLRSRMVLQEAGDGGQPCPAQLSQTKPCPIRPCYSWLLGDWSPCQIEGAECGEGLKVRNLSCVVHWGALLLPGASSLAEAAVEEERCDMGQRPAGDTPVEVPCSVPCPGDCHLTEWSPWSSCQLMCMDGRGFETQGRQARSRAVIVQVPENQDACPSQVYETRPCKGGVCHTYVWKTGGWKANKRSVWCQRSDGVNVTGGCLPHTQPSAIRHCHPPCTKPFSFCTQSGVCGCEKGFTEVMTSHGFLDYCTRTPGSGDHKKADVKTGYGGGGGVGGHPRPVRPQLQNPLREWALQAVGPDGRVRPWVYGLMAAGFVLILLIIIMSFLLCKNTKPVPHMVVHQKALTLSYDGDTDM